MVSLRKLARKVKVIRKINLPYPEYDPPREYCLLEAESTPTGYFAVYVGRRWEEKERYAVPTSFLTHPLLKMLMEKAYSDGERLVIPCGGDVFREVVSAVQCCNGRFDLGDLVEELL